MNEREGINFWVVSDANKMNVHCIALLDGASAHATKGFELGNGCCFFSPQGVPEIPALLKTEPEVRRHPEYTRQS